jgi:hypothetical protein
VLYVDTSAAVKLVLEEDESEALAAFFAAADTALITSRVGMVELRQVGRRGGAGSDRADAVSAALTAIEVDDAVERLAVGLDPSLRTLDAIHLATALAVGDGLDGFVCYDARLAAAARAVGLPVVAPA